MDARIRPLTDLQLILIHSFALDFNDMSVLFHLTQTDNVMSRPTATFHPSDTDNFLISHPTVTQYRYFI